MNVSLMERESWRESIPRLHTSLHVILQLVQRKLSQGGGCVAEGGVINVTIHEGVDAAMDENDEDVGEGMDVNGVATFMQIMPMLKALFNLSVEVSALFTRGFKDVTR